MKERLVFEIGKKGKVGVSLPRCDVLEEEPERLIPEQHLRKDLPLPELSEPEIVRHFTRLSQLNCGVDTGLYPLGSCTMKYNPKVNEEIASLAGLTRLHPYQPEELCQGALRLMYELGEYLAQIGGMDAVTLQPAAGAHGELTGMLIIRAYFLSKAQKRHQVIIPDSAHGTNPASAALCGYQAIEVKSDERGCVDVVELNKLVNEDVAAIMLTNPNTLGLFEENILEIADIVHRAGGLLYCDGANLNALLGVARPGDMGFDLLHFNLHKTFSTPHGGGGPGSGPLGVKRTLAPFLPVPLVVKQGKRYLLDYNCPLSIGKVRSFYGNFGVLIKAYAYLLSLGPEGLRQVAENAVLNANYLVKRLKDHYHLPYDRICKHEFVLSGARQKKRGIRALDIAKRLIDCGFHPPTIYFPLIVNEALMIEPTETESRQTLDRFAEALIKIAQEDAETLKSAPHHTSVGRLDEVAAARKPNLRWKE
ncbi:MAG: aminomethyl-transferring glycine dehydrogenase subunit GcvPB [Candidatus Latescibacteria bacterium]|nr:aminomethyl-transferring glycine dehydrogenase subunit GcvPB [Candidatus Latescibacterota bacterium]